MSGYDLAYGPKNPRHRILRVVEMAGYEELKPVTKQVTEEVLDVICSCGKNIVKMPRQDVLDGKMAYCRKCDPNRPRLVSVPKTEKKPKVKKVRRTYQLASEGQWSFIASLVSRATEGNALTEEEWDYVETMQMKALKTYDASLLISFLKRKLGLR